MAPPMQLRPKVWKMKRILRLNAGERVIDCQDIEGVSRAYGL